jgi:hypothetical protein
LTGEQEYTKWSVGDPSLAVVAAAVAVVLWFNRVNI